MPKYFILRAMGKSEEGNEDTHLLLGKRLRQERERLGMTRLEVASATGFTENTVYNWENGKVKIPLLAVYRLLPRGLDAVAILHDTDIKPVQMTCRHHDGGMEELSIPFQCVAPHLGSWRGLNRLLLYHNPCWFGEEHPEGELALFAGSLGETPETNSPAVHLVVPQDEEEGFMVRCSPAKRKMIEVEADDTSAAVAPDLFWAKVGTTGVFVGECGVRRPETEVIDGWHGRKLGNYLRRIGLVGG